MSTAQADYDVDIHLARKVLATIKPGLVQGLGQPTPGAMCVEAAVCYAMGLDHSDCPPCVHEWVRAVKIAINDTVWRSAKARAEGLKPLAICQLGSDKIDGEEFLEEFNWRSLKVLLKTLWPTILEPNSRKIFSYIPEEKPKDLYWFFNDLYSSTPSRANMAGWTPRQVLLKVAGVAGRGMPGIRLTDLVLRLPDMLSYSLPGTSERNKFYSRARTVLIDSAVEALRICESPGVALWDELVAAGEV